MLIVRGGEYNGESYLCVADRADPPARSTPNAVGYIGKREDDNDSAYMLWFDDRKLVFAEAYDPKSDRTMTDRMLAEFKRILTTKNHTDGNA